MLGLVLVHSGYVAPKAPVVMSRRSAAHMSTAEMDKTNDPYNPWRHIATPFAGPGTGVGAAPRGTLIRPFVDAVLTPPSATSTGKVVPSLAASTKIAEVTPQPVDDAPATPEPSPAASTPGPRGPVASTHRRRSRVASVAMTPTDDKNSPYNPWLGRTIYPFASHGVGAMPMSTVGEPQATAAPAAAEARPQPVTPVTQVVPAVRTVAMTPTDDKNSPYCPWVGRTIYPFASHGVGAMPMGTRSRSFVDASAPRAPSTAKQQSKDERWGVGAPDEDDAVAAVSLKGKVVPTSMDTNSAYDPWRGRTIYPFASHGVGAAPVVLFDDA